jgi:hypothetical protein
VKIGMIRFDDPKDLEDPSRLFILVTGHLELLDYARRYFERKDDDKSIRRAQEIRKFYKQIILDYVYIVRSIIPDDVKDEYFEMYCERMNTFRKEK